MSCVRKEERERERGGEYFFVFSLLSRPQKKILKILKTHNAKPECSYLTCMKKPATSAFRMLT